MLRKASLALAALVIAASVGAGAVAQDQNSAPHGPPAGPGLTLINERCSACHATEQVFGVRKAQDDWASTVQSMIDRGAGLNADEQKAVVAYLGTNFSTAPAPSGAPQQAAPTTSPQPKAPSH